MFSFNWPVIIATTVVLYALTILMLPFSSVAATIMIFSLIAFWTNLPGFCIMEPVRFLYMLDFVDIFTVIIAIHIGPFQAAAFNFFWNMYPKLGGAYMTWLGTAKDAMVQSFLALFVPLFYALSGNSIFAAVIIFSILRPPLYFLLSLFLPHRTIPEQLFHCVAAGIAIIIINTFYAKLFGDFFANLLMKGAAFSWMLFFIATVVILVFSITVLGFSPKKTGKRVGQQIKKVVKKQVRSHQHQQKNPDKEDIEFIRRSVGK